MHGRSCDGRRFPHFRSSSDCVCALLTQQVDGRGGGGLVREQTAKTCRPMTACGWRLRGTCHTAVTKVRVSAVKFASGPCFCLRNGELSARSLL